MFKNGAYYNGIGPYLKEYFSIRIVKASIDGGFTCPNRDGALSTGGCIFCSETGSGDFTGAGPLSAEERLIFASQQKINSTDANSAANNGESHLINSIDADLTANNSESHLINSISEDFRTNNKNKSNLFISNHIDINKNITADFYSDMDNYSLTKSTHFNAKINRLNIPVTEQMDAQLMTMKRKWQNFKCIAYFQNFTNTYAPLEVLRKKFEEALSHPECIGIAIATRPDCIDEKILNYLAELNSRTFLWVELGLQTSNDATAAYINRAYPLSVYDDTVDRLISKGIRVVTHLIFGLPGENRQDMLKSVRHVCGKNIFGIKIQLLHIMKGTRLGEMYMAQVGTQPTADTQPIQVQAQQPNIAAGKTDMTTAVIQHKADTPPAKIKMQPVIRPLEKEEYISIVADALEIIPENVTIHRLTGDAPKNLLIAPLWSTDKKSVLNGINMELKKRGSRQGCRVFSKTGCF